MIPNRGKHHIYKIVLSLLLARLGEKEGVIVAVNFNGHFKDSVESFEDQ